MFSGSDLPFSALQVCVVPANSSWLGVFAVLSEKDCRKEGENHVSGTFSCTQCKHELSKRRGGMSEP
jgi:hypothetical protein